MNKTGQAEFLEIMVERGNEAVREPARNEGAADDRMVC